MFKFAITTLPLGVVVGPDGKVEGILLRNPELEFAKRIEANADILKDVEGIATTLVDALNATNLTLLRKLAPHCKVIANCSVGYNHIDVAAATALKFMVTNTPHVLTEATADLALALILMTTRRLAEGVKVLEAEGRYPGWQPSYMLGTSISGKTAGVIGYGEIGRALGLRCRMLGMNVVRLKSKWSQGAAEDNVTALEEDAFFAAADVISIHCKLTPESRGWYNHERFCKTKLGAFVINTARGEIIDETALRYFLDNGHLGGAGLDVFCNEPVLSEHLKGAPRLVVLPHLGSSTLETRTAMGSCVMENLRAVATGRIPPNLVNSQ